MDQGLTQQLQKTSVTQTLGQRKLEILWYIMILLRLMLHFSQDAPQCVYDTSTPSRVCISC